MTTTTYDAASRLLASIPDRRGFGDATLIRQDAETVNLGGGNPDRELLPAELFDRATEDLFTDPGTATTVLHYSGAAGFDGLREAIGAHEGIDPARVIVTTGGAQGMALAVLGSLDDGDTVVVDNPVYPLFLRTLDLVNVHVESVPVDVDGIDPDALEAKLRAGLRPRAVYTVPTFHNPSGVSLSAEREARLVQLAEQYGFTILVDDPYREITFSGERPRSRRAFTDTDRAVLIGSFSKTLGTGTRLGWIGVPPEQAARYAKLRNRLDGQSSGIVQELVRRIITGPGYVPSLVKAGARYRQKAELLKGALRDQFGERIDWVEPEGGFFLWARLDEDVDFDALFAEAQRRGVTYQRGDWFAAHPDLAAPLRNAFRLSYCELDEASLRLGADRLGAAWREIR